MKLSAGTSTLQAADVPPIETQIDLYGAVGFDAHESGQKAKLRPCRRGVQQVYLSRTRGTGSLLSSSTILKHHSAKNLAEKRARREAAMTRNEQRRKKHLPCAKSLSMRPYSSVR